MRSTLHSLVAILLTVGITACTTPTETISATIPTLTPTALLPTAGTSRIPIIATPDDMLKPNTYVTRTIPPTITPEPTQGSPAPDESWTATIDPKTGSLELHTATGDDTVVFPNGSTIGSVAWSPDSHILLVEQTNWTASSTTAAANATLWKVTIENDGVSEPEPIDLSAVTGAFGADTPTQIIFNGWSPNSRYIILGYTIRGVSITVDGVPPIILDTATNTIVPLNFPVLLNPRYMSWSPDSQSFVMSAGPGRTATNHKQLQRYDVGAESVSILVPADTLIPGAVAWSPDGATIAVAAVEATVSENNTSMGVTNPRIAARRIYLFDTITNAYHLLNTTNGYQDTPVWSVDGQRLYYVQQVDASIQLMVTDIGSGNTTPVEGVSAPLPEAVGYYGQGQWDALLSQIPEETAP